MPEGHSILRYANEHRSVFAGHAVVATSPQGRFSRGAKRISGRKLLGVDTHGKHLFYTWERAETLHVHLGLYGKFRTFIGDAPPPTPNTRLALSANGTTLYLAGPTTCELIDPSREIEIRGRLGPDPLQAGKPGHSAEVFAANLKRRTIPVGAAILDQSVIAGLGNIYRAEALFLTGINPNTVARAVPEASVIDLWNTSVALLERGVREGKIVTVERARGRNETDRLFVYKRDRFPCRRCDGPISSAEMAARRIWWCDTCQPR